jgi:hypothetical protein
MQLVQIPIFPLPNIVFFPKILLPLHIFEPRYRKLVTDTLHGEHHIGMVLLREGWENDYYGTPPIFSVGCLGKMEAHERIEQGRYNILLRGVNRFEIVDFVRQQPYRVARARLLTDEPLTMDQQQQNLERDRFLSRFEQYLAEVMGIEVEKDMLERTGTLEAVINQVAATLDIPVIDKQALLQIAKVGERFDRLRRIIEERLRVAYYLRHLNIVPDDPSLN